MTAPGLAVATGKPRWRGVSHEIAAFAFPLLGIVLFAAADSASVRWSVVVYTLGLTLMYATSASYHRGHWSDDVRARLRRLDHAMIMVGIASTYTPVAVGALPTGTARVLLGVVWSLALVGVVLQVVWIHAPRALVAGCYIAIGWTAVAFVPTLWSHLGVASFSLLVGGGLVYSVGAVVYATKRPDPSPAFGFHEVFHALVLVAGLLFYATILRVVLHA
jgi:hemolysin III